MLSKPMKEQQMHREAMELAVEGIAGGLGGFFPQVEVNGEDGWMMDDGWWMMDVYFSQAETPNELVSTRDVEFIGCQLRFFFP